MTNMPKRVFPLTDMQVQKAKGKNKPYALFDGGGLYLHVTPTGGKLWRMKYTYQGKPGLLSFGPYPQISLQDARNRREDIRRGIIDGKPPVGQLRGIKRGNVTATPDTFESIGREWYEKYLHTWVDGYAERLLSALERDVYPVIGKLPVGEVTAPVLLNVLRMIEGRGAIESTHRVRAFCGRIFRYAIATGRASHDPSSDLRGAIPPPVPGHRAAITDPAKVGGLLRAIDGYTGSYTVQCALKLAPLLFVRPGELRKAEWEEVDLDAAEWNIPPGRMKMKVGHLVPLCIQAVSILTDLYKLTQYSKYVFPSSRSLSRPMSDNAILSALRRMDYGKEEMSGHGFRAMARTILDEVLQVRPDIIEHQLAHAVRDPLGRAYNRTKFLKERKEMMQMWADYLDKLKGSI